MAERVAIVGSRFWADGSLVRNFVMGLPRNTVIVSGGAKGVDTLAESCARYYGMTVVVHPADWDAHGRAAGPLRNAQIVADCDRVVAFWDGSSPGTRNTIQQAMRAGKPVTIVYSDGRRASVGGGT